MTTDLRVVVDGRALVGQRTGIGVHTAEIGSRLDISPPLLVASHSPIEDRSGLEHCRFLSPRLSPGVLWQQTVLPRLASREADVLWGPHGTLPLALRIPAVVTIHDLTSLTLPLAHRLKTVLSFNTFIGRSLEKAAAIACVSRTTADEVVRGFGIDAAKIHVVRNGVDPFWFEHASAPPDLPFDLEEGSYILFLGTIEPRKGVDTLIDAWTLLPRPRPRLVICGGEGWGVKHILRAVESHRDRAEIIITGYLPRDVVRELLRRAAVFVYPSLYEGFGMPPLEAMAAGAPVIVTDGGALPETVGDAALVVSRSRPEALKAAMQQVLADRVLGEELRERGRDHARTFSWARAAEAMQQILVRAAGTD